MHVVGARPNFMKIAPIMAEMGCYPDCWQQTLVHTGQHYDENMSQVFFEDLALPRPDIYLGVGSGSHAQQTARIMAAFEPVLLEEAPDWLIVVGDVNSTVACALVAAKLGVPVAHVEAGLRSFDRTMPEEINRIVTDHLATIHFITEPSGRENLLNEGVAPAQIYDVGNVMIDTLVRLLPQAQARLPFLLADLDVKGYMLATFHRQVNVDDPERLRQIMLALNDIAEMRPVIFPLHPRTRRRIDSLSLPRLNPQLRLLEPLGYVDFLALMSGTKLVMTDSGGIQEETMYLGVNCLTVRPNTERPITLHYGSNRLLECRYDTLIKGAQVALNGRGPGYSTHHLPPNWDGRAAERIIQVFVDLMEK